MHSKKLRTFEEVREEFRRKGVNVAEWAREHNFDPMTVYPILYGKRKCLRGESFRIAVELGVKERP